MRGVVVFDEGIGVWCQGFGTQVAARLRRNRGDPGQDVVLTPRFPTVVECLGWTIVCRHVATPQPLAIDKYSASQNSSLINAGLAMALGKKRLQVRYLRLYQRLKGAHISGHLAPPDS
jgi:hypothetical protein